MKYSLRILSLSVLAAGPAYAQSTGPITTERLTITGPGSTGDVSSMSVPPSTDAAAGTLADLIAGKAPLSAPTFAGPVRVNGAISVAPTGASSHDTATLNEIYTTNTGPNTAIGLGQTYISSATNSDFDAAEQIVADFRGTHATNTQSRLGQFFFVGSPPMQTGIVGAAVAEWNMTNRGADTGYQASPSSPTTYGGTVPYQQVGGLNFVPEADFPGAPGIGTNVTYGYIVSRSSNPSKPLGGDYSRTYMGYATDRDALVPASRGIGGEGGRGFSFWGGTTAALAPSAVGQTWGFWAHGIDLSRSTFAANDPIRIKTGQEMVWENGTGTKVAGLTITSDGALTLTDASGNASSVTGSPWTVYAPTYTQSGGSGVTITNNRVSYEIAGKTIRLQGSIQITHTTAPSSVTLTLPAGVTLKHGSAGALVNRSAGAGGATYGDQGGTSITLVGALRAAVSGSFFFFSHTAEIN